MNLNPSPHEGHINAAHEAEPERKKRQLPPRKARKDLNYNERGKRTRRNLSQRDPITNRLGTSFVSHHARTRLDNTYKRSERGDKPPSQVQSSPFDISSPPQFPSQDDHEKEQGEGQSHSWADDHEKEQGEGQSHSSSSVVSSHSAHEKEQGEGQSHSSSSVVSSHSAHNEASVAQQPTEDHDNAAHEAEGAGPRHGPERRQQPQRSVRRNLNYQVWCKNTTGIQRRRARRKTKPQQPQQPITITTPNIPVVSPSVTSSEAPEGSQSHSSPHVSSHHNDINPDFLIKQP